LDLITVKTVDTAIEAHILKSRLRNEGIISFIFDENIISLNPLYNIIVGGIKLKVPKSDVARAQEIINEIDTTLLTDENDEVINCPICKSASLYHGFKSMKGVFGVLSAILSILLTIFPVYFKTVYRCKDCGTEFQHKTPD
jgi:hypothetical protein